MPDLLLTTTESIAGHRITRTLGYVAGNQRTSVATTEGREGGRSVRSMRWVAGSHPTNRQGMLQDMIHRAEELGANAVVGVRWHQDFVYGTAVVIEPEAG